MLYVCIEIHNNCAWAQSTMDKQRRRIRRRRRSGHRNCSFLGPIWPEECDNKTLVSGASESTLIDDGRSFAFSVISALLAMGKKKVYTFSCVCEFCHFFILFV